MYEQDSLSALDAITEATTYRLCPYAISNRVVSAKCWSTHLAGQAR